MYTDSLRSDASRESTGQFPVWPDVVIPETPVYLDNAATSFPKAPGVGEAVADFLDTKAANPGRSSHRLSAQAEGMIDRVRARLARRFGIREPERLVFTLNTTDSLNIAIKGLFAGSLSGGHIVTTELEHNSVLRPLQSLLDRGRARLSRVRSDGVGRVDPREIERAIRPDTKLIVMTHASNVMGTLQDVSAVGRIARERGVLLLVDAAQTAGIVPIDVESMGIDMLAFPGHKALLGPTGIGGLYVGTRCPGPAGGGEGGLEAWREGGTGRDSISPRQPPILPFFLESGTPNTVGLAGLEKALDFLDAVPHGALVEHERALIARLLDVFRHDERYRLQGPEDPLERISSVSVTVDGFSSTELATILDRHFGIATRPGLHCAPRCHEMLHTAPEGTLRISVGPFNTEAHVEQVIDALDQIVC